MHIYIVTCTVRRSNYRIAMGGRVHRVLFHQQVRHGIGVGGGVGSIGHAAAVGAAAAAGSSVGFPPHRQSHSQNHCQPILSFGGTSSIRCPCLRCWLLCIGQSHWCSLVIITGLSNGDRVPRLSYYVYVFVFCASIR